MATYVITIPGTFLQEISDASRNTLLRKLRPSDPRQTPLGEAEDLDLLTVNENRTFSIRLEVAADNIHSAEESAKQTASAALREAGFSDRTAPLGPATVTGLDTEA
ncbi:hypothetical protein AB0M87_13555 [Streptomyces sp. NPDC051320]|uniref:hypothetical protein n=1 Tax=Streptomyces sp. NPDC051320 TaxID=3154644 RepID=UPI00343913EF